VAYRLKMSARSFLLDRASWWGAACCLRGATFQVATSASLPTFFEVCPYEYRHGRRNARSTVVGGVVGSAWPGPELIVANPSA
jgi:hypothetical protein